MTRNLYSAFFGALNSKMVKQEEQARSPTEVKLKEETSSNTEQQQTQKSPEQPPNEEEKEKPSRLQSSGATSSPAKVPSWKTQRTSLLKPQPRRW
ncbi:unnamed protein product [Callosobruchus maculatus]|uniref:Uncharacterized protein n=1 Tax=Callosobruchus maculatus TaxID=64391 RepID=A0A653D9N6_CALMS|nr:unnamed protein product [Callosobruchus maculatus]